MNVIQKIDLKKNNKVYFKICTYLDIKDNKQLCIVSKKWCKTVFKYLSKFRELSYVMPYYYIHNMNVIYYGINKKYFTGHSKWIYQLLKSINWNKILMIKNVNMKR